MKSKFYFNKLNLLNYIQIISVLLLVMLIIWSLLLNQNDFVVRRIAHAGGGIDGKTYTNSYQALDANRFNGFEYFEIDFVFTSDDRLVCLHDWEGTYKKIFDAKSKQRLSYQEFLDLTENFKGYKPCTLDGLANWMKSNPSTKIVTDLKERNLDGLKMIVKVLPNAESRVIPQIYQPEDYCSVKNLGFQQIIWTLYRFRGNQDQVLFWAEKFEGSFAITMPKNVAKTTLPKKLSDRQIPSYVHTVNDKAEADEFMTKFKISEIYTDFIKPYNGSL